MKVTAIGVQRMSGISQKTGKPYDFARLLVLRPVEPTASEKFNVIGYGFETTGLDVDKDKVGNFAAFPYPCELELVMDQRVGRTGMDSIIVSAKIVPVLKAA